MKTYIPNPIDTQHVVLPEEAAHLAELLAKNTHEVWAKGRIEEGWRYGPKRNDSLKETPCLVPYQDLTELEKSYDRNTSLEVLKVLYALGYEIVKK